MEHFMRGSSSMELLILLKDYIFIEMEVIILERSGIIRLKGKGHLCIS